MAGKGYKTSARAGAVRQSEKWSSTDADRSEIGVEDSE